MINKPMAMGMPKSIRYKTDITQESKRIINYQQSIRELHPGQLAEFVTQFFSFFSFEIVNKSFVTANLNYFY
jgi:hypothetical protein